MRSMAMRAEPQRTGQAAETNDGAEPGDGHDWRAAGEAWGHRAADWACLYEHYAIDVLVAIFGRVGVGPGTSLLDIACGSGLAVRLAAGMGATVSGVDASAELLAVATARTPDADLRLGSMFELPWPDASFDAAISINGIWGGCEEALDEAFRVLKPGAPLGISFWGEGPPLDIRGIFRPFARHSPEAHHGSMKRLNDIATPGVAEAMLEAAGFVVTERGARVSVVEWPDADVAWRAVSSIGPSVPALRGPDADVVRREIMDALEAGRDERGIYRLRSDHQFVIARKR
jgi:SAM-dependent methyltransferase